MLTFTASFLKDFNKRYAYLLTDSVTTVTSTSALSMTADVYEALRRVTISFDHREPEVATSNLFEGLLIRLILAGYCLKLSSPVDAYKDYIVASIILSPSAPPLSGILQLS